MTMNIISATKLTFNYLNKHSRLANLCINKGHHHQFLTTRPEAMVEGPPYLRSPKILNFTNSFTHIFGDAFASPRPHMRHPFHEKKNKNTFFSKLSNKSDGFYKLIFYILR